MSGRQGPRKDECSPSTHCTGDLLLTDDLLIVRESIRRMIAATLSSPPKKIPSGSPVISTIDLTGSEEEFPPAEVSHNFGEWLEKYRQFRPAPEEICVSGITIEL